MPQGFSACGVRRECTLADALISVCPGIVAENLMGEAEKGDAGMEECVERVALKDNLAPAQHPVAETSENLGETVYLFISGYCLCG